MQNSCYFSSFFLLPWQPNDHDNQFQHSRLSNIQSVLENTFNHLSIMNINEVRGELVSSREYLSFWLVAMETSQLVLYDNFSFS